MTQRVDITNTKFGSLTVLKYLDKSKWLCLCDCGNETAVASFALRKGITSTCGCATGQLISKSLTTHGMSRTPTYQTWLSMKRRCYEVTAQNYKHYGAKGIAVCDRWLHSFENFLADMGERPEGKTLDRIDRAKNYEPSNCRWATQSEQMNNTGRSVSFEGKTLKEWSKELGINYDTLSYRLRKHGSVFLPERTSDGQQSYG